MRLQTQSPLRMLHAIPQRQLCICGPIRPVHRLQEEMPEGQPDKIRRTRPRLRIDQLQLVSAHLRKHRACLGAHAHPIETRRSFNRSIRLDRNFKISRMKRRDQARIQLQQRLAAGANYKPLSRRSPYRPLLLDGRSQRLRTTQTFRRPGPSTSAKSVSQNWQIAVSPVLLRAPTKDCSPQTGKRPPRAPPAPPRPAAYRRFP